MALNDPAKDLLTRWVNELKDKKKVTVASYLDATKYREEEEKKPILFKKGR